MVPRFASNRSHSAAGVTSSRKIWISIRRFGFSLDINKNQIS